jgi:hypothetical protein
MCCRNLSNNAIAALSNNSFLGLSTVCFLISMLQCANCKAHIFIQKAETADTISSYGVLSLIAIKNFFPQFDFMSTKSIYWVWVEALQLSSLRSSRSTLTNFKAALTKALYESMTSFASITCFHHTIIYVGTYFQQRSKIYA